MVEAVVVAVTLVVVVEVVTRVAISPQRGIQGAGSPCGFRRYVSLRIPAVLYRDRISNH